MLDVYLLPIPDWGLCCPHCQTRLAGLTEHRCAGCGRRFDIMDVIAHHRPIPDIGLRCRSCGYLLTGLDSRRCPECGQGFDLRRMLDDQYHAVSVSQYAAMMGDPGDHHLAKRAPVLTGRERPLPDFGIGCGRCGEPLADAPGDTCPHCNEAFDLDAMFPLRAWVDIVDHVPTRIYPMARAMLYGAEVPYLVDTNPVARVLTGGYSTTSGLRVPREFVYDALYTLAAASQPAADYAMDDWVCATCREHVPAGFEICWNCEAPHPAEAQDGDGAI